MAFNQSQSQSKNQFAARIVSEKTGATIGWFHPVDEFARKVCGVNNVSEITYAQAAEVLPKLVANLAITDMTAEREIVDPTNY